MWSACFERQVEEICHRVYVFFLFKFKYAKKNFEKKKIESQSKISRHVSGKWKTKELLTLKGKLNCPGSHEDVRSWTRSSWSADSVDSAFVEDSDVGKERGSDSDEWGGRWDEVVRAMSASELWFDLCGSGDAQDEPIKLSATKATITGVTLSIFLCTDTIILVLMFFLFLFVSFAPLLLKTTANEESVVERTKRHLRSHKRSHSTLITSHTHT